MLIALEGIAVCFWMLLICIAGIANGPVGLVVFYEQDVKDRVVELGLITKKEIKKNLILSGAPLWIYMIFLMPMAVYLINGADSFMKGFIQLTIIFWIGGAFDRIFIDWYWVGHTKAWLIPGTEDLMPYIPKSALIKKWVGTIIGYPIFAALLSWIYSMIIL